MRHKSGASTSTVADSVRQHAPQLEQEKFKEEAGETSDFAPTTTASASVAESEFGQFGRRGPRDAKERSSSSSEDGVVDARARLSKWLRDMILRCY